MHRAPHAARVTLRTIVVVAALALAVASPSLQAAAASARHVVHGTLLDQARAEVPQDDAACLSAVQLLTGSTAGDALRSGSPCATGRVTVASAAEPCVGVHAVAGDAITVLDARGEVVAQAVLGPGRVHDRVAMTCGFDFEVQMPSASSATTFTYTGPSGRRSVTYTSGQLRRAHWTVALTA